MLDLETRHVVKICGLRTVSAARAAALGGADALGFILAESRRQVAPDLLREVRAEIAGLVDAPPVIVGVTVNASATSVAALADAGTIDVVQLSGDEDPALLDELDVPVLKTIHVDAGMDLDALERRVDPWLTHVRPVIGLLIDASVAGAYGGTGTLADWTVAARLAERYPVMLAGGLAPGNVAEGIHAVRPRGVDVSSGVEIAGEKDEALIAAFIARARQGYADQEEDAPER